MAVNWADQVGSVACGWLLESYLGVRGGGASFQGVHTTDSRRAHVLFIPLDAPDAQLRLNSWRTGAGLSSGRLLAVYETGETRIGGVALAYSAQEPVDDSLDEIRRERVLDIDEARAMSLAAVGALDYLHQRGLKHGAVDASNLFIVGEEVKLSSDTLSPADETGRRQDLVQFGALLVSALGAEAPGALPAPFREIAEQCLRPESGCTPSGILRVLDGSPPVKPVVLPRPRRGVWMLAGAGVLALAALAVLIATRGDAPPLVPEPVSTAATADKPSPAVPFGTASRATITSTPPRGEADRVSAAAPKSTSKTWAVIAATYKDFDAAQKRANRIGGAAKSLTPSVYPPRGQGTWYYVVFGTGMTQQEAEDLLSKARAAGAPSDSYVTKLATSE